MRILLRALGLAAVAAILSFALVAPTSAHERRAVGPYQFVVGFSAEPAYLEQPNGASLAVTRDGQPVEGAEKTLKVEVTQGADRREFELKRVFGKPGSYVADFIPTKAGAYTFRYFGTIDGVNVNEKFDSGPGRFNDVENTATLQFPVKVPSNGELAAQGSQGVEQAPAASQADVQKALDEADSARQTGMVVGGLGLIAGLIGIAVGVVALSRRPGSTRSSRHDGEPV